VAGQVVTVTLGAGCSLANSATGSITVDTITNPIAGAYTGAYSVATSENTTAATATTAIGGTGGSVTAVTFTASSVTAHASANWTVSFAASAGGAISSGETVTITFPAGFTLPSSPATVALGGSFVGCSGTTSGVVVGQVVTVTLGGGCSLANSGTGTVMVNGLTNPVAGAYTTLYSVATSEDPTATTATTAVAGTAPASVTFAPASFVASDTSTWGVTFTTSAFGALAAPNTITVTFPAGFTLPTTPTVLFASGFSGTCTGTSTGSTTGQVVTITLSGGCALALSTTGTITIAGIGNPGASSNASTGFGVATSQDTTSANPASAIVINGVGAPSAALPPSGVPAADFGSPASVSVSATQSVTDTVTSGTSSSVVTVPMGALPAGTTVSTYPITDTASLQTQVPPGNSYVASIAVSWSVPVGTSAVATIPITLTITDPNIKAGDVIYEVTLAGLTKVGTATVDGSVTITFTTDPIFMVTATILQDQAALSVNSTSGVVGTALMLTTSGGSGTGAVSYSTVDGSALGCSVSNGMLLATSAGTCVVAATKAGDGNYLALSTVSIVTFTLAINVSQATLTVTSTSGTGGTPLTLTTSGGSGTGALSYSVVNGTASGCAISNGALSATSAGTCVVTATKAADATYGSVSSSATFVTLAIGTQGALKVTSISGTLGTALTLTTSGGSGTGALSYSVLNGTASGCAISNSALSASSAGTCLVTATKAADATYGSVSSAGTVVTLAKSAIGKPSTATPGPAVVTFGFYSSTLSTSAKNVLTSLSRKLVSGASVTIIGYALKDIPLAHGRANAVAAFLLGLKHVHVKTQIVTNRSIRKVKVITTTL
jgi:hypothetical protein